MRRFGCGRAAACVVSAPLGQAARLRVSRRALLLTRLTVAASGRREASNGTRCRFIVSAIVLACDPRFPPRRVGHGGGRSGRSLAQSRSSDRFDRLDRLDRLDPRGRLRGDDVAIGAAGRGHRFRRREPL